MLKGIATTIMNESTSDRYRQCALEALRQLSRNPRCPSKARECAGLMDALVRTERGDPTLHTMARYIKDSIQSLFDSILHLGRAFVCHQQESLASSDKEKPAYLSQRILENFRRTEAASHGTPTAAGRRGRATSPAGADKENGRETPVPPSAKRAPFRKTQGLVARTVASQSHRKQPRAITVDMTGLLGDKQLNDAYTHALLLVIGVTSVTMDPKNNRVIVFSHSAEEIRPALMRAINGVRELHQQAVGSRTPLAALDQATYLDDEEEDDFFGEGTISERQSHMSVEERIARRKAAKAASGSGDPSGLGAGGGGLFGMAKAATSWLGW